MSNLKLSVTNKTIMKQKFDNELEIYYIDTDTDADKADKEIMMSNHIGIVG